jgi:transposase
MDPSGRRVLEVVAGLKPQQRPTVQAVRRNMWPAFAAAITAQLPQARIVSDPYHVVSRTNAAINAVRRAKNRQRQRTGEICKLENQRTKILAHPATTKI